MNNQNLLLAMYQISLASGTQKSLIFSYF